MRPLFILRVLISVLNITCLLHRVYYWGASDRERTASTVRSACRLIRPIIAHCVCSPPNTFQVIKSRGLRLTGHVARMGERRGACTVMVGKPEGNRALERQAWLWG